MQVELDSVKGKLKNEEQKRSRAEFELDRLMNNASLTSTIRPSVRQSVSPQQKDGFNFNGSLTSSIATGNRENPLQRGNDKSNNLWPRSSNAVNAEEN